MPLFLQQLEKNPNTSIKTSRASSTSVFSHSQSTSLYNLSVEKLRKLNPLTSQESSIGVRSNDSKMNQATGNNIFQASTEVRNTSSTTNLELPTISINGNAQFQSSSHNGLSRQTTRNSIVSMSASTVGTTNSSVSAGNILERHVEEAGITSESRSVLSPSKCFSTQTMGTKTGKENSMSMNISESPNSHPNTKTAIMTSTRSLPRNATAEKNTFDAVNNLHCFSSSNLQSTTSLGLSQGSSLQTAAALGPSQQGVLSNPSSSVAVPFYSSLTQHPFEQSGLLGRMAAPSASSNHALEQPPPTTSANSSMPAHSSSWQR